MHKRQQLLDTFADFNETDATIPWALAFLVKGTLVGSFLSIRTLQLMKSALRKWRYSFSDRFGQQFRIAAEQFYSTRACWF
jgi:hypothetical protein